MKFQITNNTDNVDIDAKSLGLNVHSEELPDNVYDNRGLHIQIKYNEHKATFKAAVKLTNLLTTAPEMLEALIAMLPWVTDNPDAEWEEKLIRKLIKKAGVT